MAELTVHADEIGGILKEIDSGAIDLVFQAIQEDIYAHPTESFVRETISNGLDSHVEKEIFNKISKGAPVESFYRQKQDGRLLKDSEYNPSYYDKHHLSDRSIVEVRYTDGNPRDMIAITDYGVGLGGERLKGFFRIGYSTKRNMKLAIGKFGAGAKAGLATGVDYFVMHTTYNGYTTSFMILKNNYDPITPKSELGKTEVWEVRMANGSVRDLEINWTKTSAKNGVTIELEVKKHNKEAFINAVKNQFQYFNGRVTLEYNENGSRVFNTLNEKPLYESDTLLIPKYSTYSSPHILVDGISYGLISWQDLELQKRSGKIAIKVKATDVDITQSRESLKWTEKTKLVILAAVKKAEEEASDYITSLLEIQDNANIFALNNLYGSMRKNSENDVSSVFSKFLDMYNIKPKISINYVDTSVPGGSLLNITSPLSRDLFNAIFYKYTIKKVTMESRGDTVKLHTSTVDNWEELRDSKIIYANDANLGPKLAEHLMNSKYDVTSLIYIRSGSLRVKDAVEIGRDFYDVTTLTKYAKWLIDTYADLNLDTYDVVYTEDKEEDLDKARLVSRESLAKQRRDNQQVLYTHRSNIELNNGKSSYYRSGTQIKHTIRNADISKVITSSKVVTTGKFKNLGRIIEDVQWICEGQSSGDVIYVAQDILPSFAPHCNVITDYFRTVNEQTGELMIGEHIRNLNTIRLLSELRKEYEAFSDNYAVLESVTTIDVASFKSMTNRLGCRTIEELLLDGSSLKKQELEDIWKYLDSLNAFQHVVSTGTPEEIKNTAVAMFNSDKIYTVDAYDKDLVDTVKTEFKRISSITPILELLPYRLSVEAADLIKLLINTKNKENVDI